MYDVYDVLDIGGRNKTYHSISMGEVAEKSYTIIHFIHSALDRPVMVSNPFKNH